MVRALRRFIALVPFCCALLATPAHAVVTVTYVFDVAGSGLTTYADYYTPKTPYNGTRIIFVIPDVTDKSLFMPAPTAPGPAFLYATPTGLGFSFNGGLGGHGTLQGIGGVCFSNPLELLPAGQVTLVGGNGCGAVDYQYVGPPSDAFSGTVVNFNILSGDPYGIGSGYVLNKTNVPEPATWALMLVGFGAIGCAIRSRRRLAARLS